jgi:hypothetical protein
MISEQRDKRDERRLRLCTSTPILTSFNSDKGRIAPSTWASESSLDPYVLTSDGQRVAIFYTKVQDRLLRPLLAAHQPPAPPPLRNALRIIDTHVTQYIDAPDSRSKPPESSRQVSII